MKLWMLYKENKSFAIDQNAYEVWGDTALSQDNILRPVRFSEILNTINERDRTRSDLRVSLDEISYLNILTENRSRVFSKDSKCYLEAEDIDDPLVMIILRIGRVVFMEAEKAFS